MSEWIRASRDVKKEFKEVGKLVGKSYSYQTGAKSLETDKKMRKLIAKGMDEARNVVFDVMEDFYKDSDIDNAEKLKEVMDWMNVFFLELSVDLIYDEDATSKEFGDLIKHDLAILKNVTKLAETLKGMEKKPKSVSGRANSIRKYVMDLLKLYKERRHSLES